MQSAWTPFAYRASSSTDTISSGNNNYWMMGMIQPWWWMGMSPRDMADIYASDISAMTDSVAKGTRMLLTYYLQELKQVEHLRIMQDIILMKSQD